MIDRYPGDQSNTHIGELRRYLAKSLNIWLSGLTALAQLVGILLSLRLVDSTGRRTLVLTSLGLVVLALMGLGGCFYLARVASPAVKAFGRGRVFRLTNKPAWIELRPSHEVSHWFEHSIETGPPFKRRRCMTAREAAAQAALERVMVDDAIVEIRASPVSLTASQPILTKLWAILNGVQLLAFNRADCSAELTKNSTAASSEVHGRRRIFGAVPTYQQPDVVKAEPFLLNIGYDRPWCYPARGSGDTGYRLEPQAEMLERISKQIHAFKMSESREFVEDVFASCWVQPVIIVSLEAKCGGDALDGVITTSKILSYENRSRGHPRIVVDISGSRAAIDAGIQFAKRRVVGVSVGFFSETEALKYVVDRIPKSFKDPLRQMIVDQFDCHVLKLEGVCELVNKKQPTDKAQVQTIIKKEIEAEKKNALDGWISFSKNIETSMDVALRPEVWKKVATILLETTQESLAICERLHEGIIEADGGKSESHRTSKLRR